MANEIASMIENPEYQQTVQKILQAPPAIRALANISPADEAYMKQLLEKNLLLRKLGEDRTASRQTLQENKRQFGNKLALERDKLAATGDIDTGKLALERDKLAATGDIDTGKLALERDKLNTVGNIASGKAGLEGEKIDTDRNLGLGTSQAYYNLRTTAAQDALDLAKRKDTTSNILGIANLGAGIYGSYNQNETTNKLLPYLRDRGGV